MRSLKEIAKDTVVYLLRGFGFGIGLYAAFKLLYALDTFV